MAHWNLLESLPFVLAIPEAPYLVPEAAENAFEWALWPSGDWEVIEKAIPLTERYILRVVEQMKRSFDTGDTFLFGFSQGAVIAYIVGIRHSELLNGLIIAGGPGLLTPMRNRFAGESRADWVSEDEIRAGSVLRVLIAHGTEDDDAPFDLALQSRRILTEHGHRVTLCPFDGAHELTLPTMEMAARWIEDPLASCSS